MSDVLPRAVIVLDRRMRAALEEQLPQGATVEAFAAEILWEHLSSCFSLSWVAGFPHHVQVNSGVESQIETGSGECRV